MMTNPTSSNDGDSPGDLQDPTRAEQPSAGSSGGDSSFRLDTLGVQGADGASPSARKGLPMQGVFFAIMVLAVGAALLVMRQMGLGPSLSLAGTNGEFTPPAKRQDHTKILKDLSTSQVESQVPADQVQKNPFKIADSIPTNITAAPTGDPEADARRAAELARREAEARVARVQMSLASLQVHGILGGSNPLARVNNENVRIGDTLAEIFVVRSITTREIELECEGDIYTISLDDRRTTTKKSSGPAAPRGANRK